MRTKIVATIGPRSESAETLAELVSAGMDIARMNFSHCQPEEFKTRKARIKSAADAAGRHVKILQDLRGPRIRVGVLPDEGVRLTEDQEVVFATNGEKDPPAGIIRIDDPYLHLSIKIGDPLFLANGDLELIVEKTEGARITGRVIRGGRLFSRKAVNVPNTELTTTGPTEKDMADVEFALGEGVDYIAVSFVQTAKDIERLRKIVGTSAKIIAKIETAFSLKHIDSIIQASDGIMVARGDLGIEIPIEQVPYVQKNLIRQAIWHGKPAITATEMLRSMITSERPTRAEVSDIANAVWDGSDGVMLSDETASGNYPVLALKTMVKIVQSAEKYHYERKSLL